MPASRSAFARAALRCPTEAQRLRFVCSATSRAPVEHLLEVALRQPLALRDHAEAVRARRLGRPRVLEDLLGLHHRVHRRLGLREPRLRAEAAVLGAAARLRVDERAQVGRVAEALLPRLPRALDERLDLGVVLDLAQREGLLAGDERRHGRGNARRPDRTVTAFTRRDLSPGDAIGYARVRGTHGRSACCCATSAGTSGAAALRRSQDDPDVVVVGEARRRRGGARRRSPSCDPDVCCSTSRCRAVPGPRRDRARCSRARPPGRIVALSGFTRRRDGARSALARERARRTSRRAPASRPSATRSGAAVAARCRAPVRLTRRTATAPSLTPAPARRALLGERAHALAHVLGGEARPAQLDQLALDVGVEVRRRRAAARGSRACCRGR